MSDLASTLLDVADLRVEYRQRRKRAVRAVDGVSFTVQAGHTVGLVGESGSGKSSIGGAILGLAPVAAGRVMFRGQDITYASAQRRRELSREIQIVFQDPFGSLNPSRTIEQTLVEPLIVHEQLTASQRRLRVEAMLERVGLPLGAARRLPAEFSGGQRQRIAIARALMASPRLVICDEPVSALDLSVQAQILNLLADLQQGLGLAYLFISHDLSVVRHVAEQVVVLYRGQVMETGDCAAIYANPRHPYTRALLASAPIADVYTQRKHREARTHDSLRHTAATNGGCAFVSRCNFAIDLCRDQRPSLRPVDDDANGIELASCHRMDEDALRIG